MNVGNGIRIIRELRGMSKYQMVSALKKYFLHATDTYLTKYVDDIEDGRQTDVSTLELFAKALGVPVSFITLLCEEADDPASKEIIRDLQEAVKKSVSVANDN